ncbi:MAG: hypothetical protein ACRD34_09685 [Bryobacteraceae bacterium]
MQLLEAGNHKYLLLELDQEFVANIAREAGFQHRIEDRQRALSIDLIAVEREAPLLLFDAAEPANLGWFSRCQFYVDGATGSVLQTPLWLANQRDRQGRPIPNAIRLQIPKELPGQFRMPGRQAVSEQVIYAVFFNFLNALTNTGVAVCGGPIVKPLAGRTETGRRTRLKAGSQPRLAGPTS